MQEFRELPEFEGKIVEYKILDRTQPMHSASGPEVRVFIEKADGEKLVIKRIITLILAERHIERLMDEDTVLLPKELLPIAERRRKTKPGYE